MALDVRIGKHNTGKVEGIALCPKIDYDICNPEYTLWPRESFRSGSYDFWDFWRKYVKEIYYDNEHTNLYPLKPIIDKINKLPDSVDSFDNDVEFDRMKWFKFWANRAVELYGEQAYISFS